MPQPSLSRERILDAIESCRPASDDLFTPELADVADQIAVDPQSERYYERLQNLDLKISAAFHDVEIPPGLEQRLVAKVELARLEDARFSYEDEALATAPPANAAPLPSPRKQPKNSRRRFLVSGGVLAAALSILFVVYVNFRPSIDLTRQTAEERAMQFFNAENATPGQLLAKTPSPAEFPFSSYIRRFSTTCWRPVENFLGHSGIAFDLRVNGERATLYAIEQTIPDLESMPVDHPSNTGGCCVAAWQENGLTYILVVRGNQNTYQNCLVPRKALV
jgi:hypothetical protein